MIGYAEFNIDNFKADYNPKWLNDNWSNYFYERQSQFKDCLSIYEGRFFKHGEIKDIEKLVGHLSEIDENLQLFYYDGVAAIVGYENTQFVIEAKCVKPIQLKDYSQLSASQLNLLTGDMAEANLLPATTDDASITSINDKKAQAEAKVAEAKAQLAAQEAALREEMDRKLKELEEAMAGKLSELNDKIKQYENELFVLESQIFAIRCYTGEVIKFHQIRSGTPAPTDEQLIMYQKMRFLDEELGKHVAMFDFEGEDDDKRLMSVLKYRDDIAELLAPGTKSLTVLRTSRTGTFIAAHDSINNCLDEYEMYHGKQLALLLRNGENLYIGWCDADKVVINTENVFFSTTSSTESIESDEDTYESKTDIHEALSRYYLLAILQGVIDNNTILRFPEKFSLLDSTQKYVVYSLAEGWITSSKYGSFKEMLDKSADIMPVQNDKVLSVLSLRPDGNMWSRGNDTYENDRGVGEKNRTRGVRLSKNKLYPINLVLYDATYEYEYEAVEVKRVISTKPICCKHSDGSTTYEDKYFESFEPTGNILFTDIDKCTIDFDSYKNIKADEIDSYISRYYLDKDTMYQIDNDEVKRYYPKFLSWYDTDEEIPELTNKVFYKRFKSAKLISKNPHTFVSVTKEGYGSYENNFKPTEYHVNFEIFNNEYISTTFLCSTWLNEVITTSNIGDLRFPGVIPTFADLLPYLYVLKEHLAKVDEKVKQMLIDAGGETFVNNNVDWDATLCEWRIANQIHYMTPTRAKRFLKTVQ